MVDKDKCGSDPVFDADGGDNSFACATKRGVYIFELNGQSLKKRRGLFG